MSRRSGRLIAATAATTLPLGLVTLVALSAPDPCDTSPQVTLSGDAGNAAGWSSDPQTRREQQENARTIVQVGIQHKIPAKGLAVAIATAKVESQLVNVHYGDRDSLGLFQQRDAWGPESARMNPAESAEMFYTGGKGGQPGLLDTDGWEDMPIGDAAQDVQVSAFPERYGEQARFAVGVVNALTGGGDNVQLVAAEAPSACERSPIGGGPLQGEAYERVTWRGATMDVYTASALAEAERRLGFRLQITQGAYHSGVSASAGTHDGGGVIDLPAYRVDEVVLTLRQVGFAAWYRPASDEWSPHIHAVQLGHAKLSPEARDQVVSYMHGGDGLAGDGADNGPNVAPVVFPWPPETVQASGE